MVEALSLRDFVLVGHSAGGRKRVPLHRAPPGDGESPGHRRHRPRRRQPGVGLHVPTLQGGVRRVGLPGRRDREAALPPTQLHRRDAGPPVPAHDAGVPRREEGVEAGRRLVEAYERPDLWDEWSRIECPTLIARGRQSNLLTHEVAVRMREAISRARLAELEGGGHWFYQELPGPFEATVRWFLEAPPS